ncbi:pentatricopeptide repeat-containing protein At1g77170-like, partial [Phalaenopsis equestris]|uniref:pentatricopeptide repeat-containing protein At1g77170-like n=1 Tax=Phalaenopsis equestris TaxID=78828 RepID=UPI0009E56308
MISLLNSPSSSSPAAAAATHLQSCFDQLELSQIHAFVLRRNLLLLPFHWNSLMRCYVRLSIPSSALHLFVHMSRACTYPDRYSLPIALKASFTSFSFSFGRQLHSVAIKHGLSRHQFSESGLISLYAKAGHFIPANQLFDENPHRNLGSWNALISGYAQAGHSSQAIDLFIRLRRTGETPDDMTMLSVASACGALGEIQLAEQIHRCAIQARVPQDTMLSNSLIDMYAKCGRTDIAYKVFERMTERDVSSWTAMMMGLATHGDPERALELYGRMKEEGRVAANHVTMVAVLCACAHAGLVEEGMRKFEEIVGGRVEGVEATAEHYGCVA